jgi:hypothetical protein
MRDRTYFLARCGAILATLSLFVVNGFARNCPQNPDGKEVRYQNP